MFRKMASICAFLALTCVGVSVGQTAEENNSNLFFSDTYVRFEGGWSWGANANITDRSTTPIAAPGVPAIIIFGDAFGTVPGTLNDIGSSYLLRLGLGKRLWENVRGELSASYRGGFEADDLDAFPSIFRSDISVFAVLANVYLDIPVNMDRFQPYVGAGIGVARVSADNLINTNIPGTPPFWSSQPGGSSTNFAWQASVGAMVKVGERTSLDFGYRYFDAGDINYNAGLVSITGFPPVATAGAQGDLRAHEAYMALIVNLN